MWYIIYHTKTIKYNIIYKSGTTKIKMLNFMFVDHDIALKLQIIWGSLFLSVNWKECMNDERTKLNKRTIWFLYTQAFYKIYFLTIIKSYYDVNLFLNKCQSFLMQLISFHCQCVTEHSEYKVLFFEMRVLYRNIFFSMEMYLIK
jgi:hypothetical protein